MSMGGMLLGTKWPGKLDSEPDWYDGGNPGQFEDTNNASSIARCTFTIKANGTFSVVNFNLGNVSFANIDWLIPANTSCTRHWWVRFTAANVSGIGTHTATTGWLQLNADRSVVVEADSADSDGGNEKFVNYTIEFSPSSSGTPIAQTTGVGLYAYSLSS